MNFYQSLSRHYDEIFAADEAEMRFVGGLLPRGAAILDIGCGTGNKTVLLGDGAASVDAVDLDASMIARAETAHARPNIHYAALNMLDIGKAFANKRFDAVLCLGNTLVHLPSPAAISGLLRDIHALLAENGLFIPQILNYDRILDQNVTELPLLETANARFTRGYARQDGQLRFVTCLEDKATGETLRGDIPLYPLRQGELATLLAEAGFSKVEYFGSYAGDALHSGSFILLACCRKA